MINMKEFQCIKQVTEEWLDSLKFGTRILYERIDGDDILWDYSVVVHVKPSDHLFRNITRIHAYPTWDFIDGKFEHDKIKCKILSITDDFKDYQYYKLRKLKLKHIKLDQLDDNTLDKILNLIDNAN
jgi:hypothetical protein